MGSDSDESDSGGERVIEEKKICKYILKKGKRSGKRCKTSVKDSKEYCKKHDEYLKKKEKREQKKKEKESKKVESESEKSDAESGKKAKLVKKKHKETVKDESGSDDDKDDKSVKEDDKSDKKVDDSPVKKEKQREIVIEDADVNSENDSPESISSEKPVAEVESLMEEDNSKEHEENDKVKKVKHPDSTSKKPRAALDPDTLVLAFPRLKADGTDEIIDPEEDDEPNYPTTELTEDDKRDIEIEKQIEEYYRTLPWLAKTLPKDKLFGTAEEKLDSINFHVNQRTADLTLKAGFHAITETAEAVAVSFDYQVKGLSNVLDKNPEVSELLKIIRLTNADKVSKLSPEMKLAGICIATAFVMHKQNEIKHPIRKKTQPKVEEIKVEPVEKLKEEKPAPPGENKPKPPGLIIEKENQKMIPQAPPPIKPSTQ